MIGLFDSGLGGLSVLNHFHKKLSEYGCIFYGDSLNAPYGGRSEKEIYLLAKSAVDFLFSRGASLVLVVCNTVSAKVLRDLQEDCYNKENKKVLGIIIPNVENILKINEKNSRLGIIGTTQTINSGRYLEEIGKKRKDIQIFSKKCPKFARNIENNKFKSLDFLTNIKEEMNFFKEKNLDYLLLACTHYSFIKKEIKAELSSKTIIIDSADIVIDKTIKYLKKHKDLKINKQALTLVYTSGDLEVFKKISRKFLKKTENRSLEFLKTPVFPYN